NLSWNTDDESLKNAFSEFGSVQDSIVMKDRETGRSRGFGFVTFGSAQEAEAAITGLNDQDLDGRRIKVNLANARGGGGGGGGKFQDRDLECPKLTLLQGTLVEGEGEDMGEGAGAMVVGAGVTADRADMADNRAGAAMAVSDLSKGDADDASNRCALYSLTFVRWLLDRTLDCGPVIDHIVSLSDLLYCFVVSGNLK
ncbi:hypothetical protein B0H19DRAFT_919584, partial [Mycena capillaripes]